MINSQIRRQVLVVEDEAVNREMLGFIVCRDYDVLYAENGRQALDMIREHQQTLSLILLDILMREMNGYEVLEMMHNDEELKRIPVIVLTSEKEAEIRSFQLGAVDFIPKPYDMPEIILARVRRSIELAEDKVIIQEAKTDSLTNLYSKAFFFNSVSLFDRYFTSLDMDAVIVDINRFHLINDLYGRKVGDDLLCAISSYISGIVGTTKGVAGRYGSNAFCIYIAHSDEHAKRLSDMSDRLNELFPDIRLTLRAGVYEYADRSLAAEMRFDRTAAACSRNRSSYSSLLSVYDDDVHNKELYDERLIMDMDRAMKEKQFAVWYQPKFDIRGDVPRLTSAEALIRWKHPEYGMISPGTFIPLFERHGLVQKLDHYVWAETAAQIRQWKETSGRSIPVSVKVSRVDINDEKLLDRLKDITASNGLSPDEFLLEITESAYTDNSSQIVGCVNDLRDHGFRIEMDDFGSGYSSLNMLADLPIDALKMDMKFIRNISTKEKDRRLVELVLEIARFLGVPVIAEGVETEEQYLLLKKMGTDIIQGYYFSKPLPAEEFSALIEREI